MDTPLGQIMVNYDIRSKPQGECLVLVDGRVVCQLPCSEMTHRIKPGDHGTILLELLAYRSAAEGKP